MKINYAHGLDENALDNNTLEVEFQGIKGDRGTVETIPLLGNIFLLLSV